MIEVYIKIDEKNRIKEINSSIFLKDTTGWIKIDEGEGNRYAHAQRHYFSTPLTKNGLYLYKLEDGIVKERTEEEKNQDLESQNSEPSLEERIADLETALADIAYGG